jgi:hypothetical protein
MAEIPVQTLQEGSREVNPPAIRSQDPVADVAKLLSTEAAPAESSPEKDTQADPPPMETWELKALAEKLGATPEALYEQLKVSMADGQEMSLGALKDAYKPAAELEKARAGLLDEMTSNRKAVLDTQQEFSALLQMFDPSTLNPDVLRSVNQMAEKQRQQQIEGTLKAIPEWKDPIARAADWVDIRRVGKEYGFSDVELKLIEQGYGDHRLVAMARALGKQPRAETAKPAPKVAVAPKGGKPQTDAQRHGHLKTAVKSGRMSPFTAVDQLLKG